MCIEAQVVEIAALVLVEVLTQFGLVSRHLLGLVQPFLLVLRGHFLRRSQLVLSMCILAFVGEWTEQSLCKVLAHDTLVIGAVVHVSCGVFGGLPQFLNPVCKIANVTERTGAISHESAAE